MSTPIPFDLRPDPAEASAPEAWLAQVPAGEGGAPAEQEGGGGGSPFGGFLFPAVLMFAIFYFVLIRPEKRKRQKREAMLGAMKKGDKVMTNGGMYAVVISVQDDVVTLQAADNVRLKFSRAAVQTIISEDGGEPPKS